MKIKRILQTSVDIQDPYAVLGNDTSGNLLRMLTDTYVGKCYQACYIEKINRIIDASSCVINQNGGETFGMMNVKFEVDAVIIVEGEYINGCQIGSKQTAGSLAATTRNAAVFINGAPLELNTNHIVTVRAHSVLYNPLATEISVNATMPTFNTKYPVYFIPESDASLDARSQEILAPGIAYLEELYNDVEKLKKTKPHGIEYFEKRVVYTYREQKPDPPDAKPMELLKMLKENKQLNGFICLDKRIKPLRGVIYVYSKLPTDPNATIRQRISAVEAYSFILSDLINQVRTIHEMCTIYNTDELMKQHMPLWQFYRKNQKE